jgi:hypothetical protein
MTPPPSVDTMRWPPPKFFCSYSRAMRGGQVQVLAMSFAEMEFERFALAVHEAGHAVVSFAFGHGCSRICLSTHAIEQIGGGIGIAYDGAFYGRSPKTFRWAGCKEWAIATGICSAAGPAAELAVRLHNSSPTSQVQGNWRNSGDDASITTISRHFSSRRGPAAYRRHVWGRAQKIIAKRNIMTAILAVATELNRAYWPPAPEPAGTTTNTMHGATARAIMRKAGIISGMLEDVTGATA